MLIAWSQKSTSMRSEAARKIFAFKELREMLDGAADMLRICAAKLL
jgi:hypothetical protein